jgi:hypothetical protein
VVIFFDEEVATLVEVDILEERANGSAEVDQVAPRRTRMAQHARSRLGMIFTLLAPLAPFTEEEHHLDRLAARPHNSGCAARGPRGEPAGLRERSVIEGRDSGGGGGVRRWRDPWRAERGASTTASRPSS